MCLLVLMFRDHPEFEVLLGGNRDEQYHRLADPPAVLSKNPEIWGGRDRQAGGTWLGRNEYGVLAAITNFHDPQWPIPPQALSRGSLLLELLAHRSPLGAASWITEQPLHRYRPFNLLFGNREQFYSFASHGAEPPRALLPGCYALSNSALDDREWGKVAAAQGFLSHAKRAAGESLLLRLQAFLCDPPPSPGSPPAERSPRDSVFVNTPGYGTVSGSLLVSGGPLGERYYYADGVEMRKAQLDWAPRILTGADAVLPGSPFHRIPDFPH